ncbi:transcriptional regulator [Methylobacterium tarhaniae]|uniref:Transcriptional regulator n=1 Tax=Methylobacterium tarhaniae TaxID=1187852 RepID=A0A0J6S5W4_9HYPH|nr:SMC-Scp complex subunit ScpB [Methylobacterium tarhaniae]KMO30585.1 transcriptional regulator [Methylobacterium tarhaniae]
MARARSRPFDPALAGLPPEARWRAWMGHVEAVLFASPAPVPREALARVVGPECRLDALIADIGDALRDRPYELVAVAGGWQLRTRAEFASAIRAAAAVPEEARGGALTAGEQLVLAAIAYLQPVTRLALSRMLAKEVSRDVIARLKRLDLVGAGPRAPEPGAPLTYVTTPAFLARFGLASLRDLPDIEALEEAGLLDPNGTADTPSDPFDAMLGLSGEEA